MISQSWYSVWGMTFYVCYRFFTGKCQQENLVNKYLICCLHMSGLLLCLLFPIIWYYIEYIYLSKENTKYISSKVLEILAISQKCTAKVKLLIFSTHEMKHICGIYCEKVAVLFCFSYLWNKQRTDQFKHYFFRSHFPLNLLRSVC